MASTQHEFKSFVKRYLGEVVYYVAESDSNKFLTRKHDTTSPSDIMGGCVIQSPNRDESPLCCGCVHHGTRFCVNGDFYFCSLEHMSEFIREMCFDSTSNHHD